MNEAIDLALSKRLSTIVKEYNLSDPPLLREAVPSSIRHRRDFNIQDYNNLATLSLVRVEGGLRWIYESPSSSRATRRGRRSSMHLLGSKTIHEFRFNEVPHDRIISEIETLDVKLTRNPGLRLFNHVDGKLEKLSEDEVFQGRVLLFLHGIFSKGDMLLDELRATELGSEFLKRCTQRYQAILVFDHLTLSVSPWINALDLEHQLDSRISGPIDIVCHGRGGLVASWWLRAMKRNVENVVFVGSPLQGTNFASPGNLRHVLQVLTNVFQNLESARPSTFDPLSALVTGLAKIVGGLLRLGSSLPPADAVIVGVPGLAAQSLANNAEIRSLHQGRWSTEPKFYTVISDFRPTEDDQDWWYVHRLLQNPDTRVVSWSAEPIHKSANDLVVQTESMNFNGGGGMGPSKIAPSEVCYFERSPVVHHWNYFRQERTIELLDRALF